MKKIVLFFLLVALGSQAFGKLYPPIQPYLENDYTLSQVKTFALANTELSSSWRKELVSIVNKGLVDAGENMTLNTGNVSWILDHVSYERKKITNFGNSRDSLNNVVFYSDIEFDGMVGIFDFNKCNLVIFKTRCMNLLKVPVTVVEAVVPQTNPIIERVLLSVPPKTEKIKLDLNLPISSRKEGEINIWYISIPVVAILVGAGCSLFKKEKKSFSTTNRTPSTNTNNFRTRPGKPGGAPVTPGSNPGGPGGANTTK